MMRNVVLAHVTAVLSQLQAETVISVSTILVPRGEPAPNCRGYHHMLKAAEWRLDRPCSVVLET
jgi:hypothetical protein